MSLFQWIQLFQGNIPTGAPIPLFTVPAGHLYIVRSISLTDAGQPNTMIRISDNVSGVAITNLITDAGTAAAYQDCRIACVDGQEIIANGYPFSADVTITGYDITL